MSDVPDELLREILLRLPGASLFRFRCVSKSWKDLIESNEFIGDHLNYSRKTNANINIVLRSSKQLYSADFDLLNETNMATFKELPHPFKTPRGVTEILGSCEGLLVLRNQMEDVTTLWNPSVKRFHVIPCTSIEMPGYSLEKFCGFGYDVMSDDYKVIRIFQFCGFEYGEINSRVYVYSLKSDSWRRILDFPYSIKSFDEKNYGVLANGALHCIITGNVKLHGYIAAIDLGTEEYRLVPLPIFADGDDINSLDVAALGGCLSLMCNVNEDRVDLWVMKEYGVQESWSILFSYDVCGYDFMKWPLAYSKCGRKVLVISYDDVLRWYDLDKIHRRTSGSNAFREVL